MWGGGGREEEEVQEGKRWSEGSPRCGSGHERPLNRRQQFFAGGFFDRYELYVLLVCHSSTMFLVPRRILSTHEKCAFQSYRLPLTLSWGYMPSNWPSTHSPGLLHGP